ncbi:hypothetical protein ISG33_16775 [Glaciecola sp. MH2013]|uniref:MazG nucleotide pyrophosphohydrolase domain-containing protein n=1 Tax=Glaciecola sp. MH2013 TaxID=2785524 RepID=UPI00189DAADB|nr:MazG nucleotide pyrophosphohydrolase domain-containing protein [Glaciecola sp. MH2013]MBF7075058.1 hypothetical protein [Glaciecola sp. MH2013]
MKTVKANKGAYSNLIEALSIQRACAEDGFDWDEVLPVFAKIEEELLEVREEYGKDIVDKSAIKEELGDLLFAVVNLCRHLDVNPDEAMALANLKFQGRYSELQSLAEKQGKVLVNLNMEEKEALWQRVKQLELKSER